MTLEQFEFATTEVRLNGKLSSLDAIQTKMQEKAAGVWNCAYAAFYNASARSAWVAGSLNDVQQHVGDDSAKSAKVSTAFATDQQGNQVHWVYFAWYK